MKTNESHDNACSLLGYVVEEPFNGDTDWYVVAAFDHSDAAEQYAAFRNSTESPEYPYRVANVGTRRRDMFGNLISA